LEPEIPGPKRAKQQRPLSTAEPRSTQAVPTLLSRPFLQWWIIHEMILMLYRLLSKITLKCIIGKKNVDKIKNSQHI